MQLALADAEAGDANGEKMARQTLEAALSLIDPVWGGVYQYSDQRDWKSPHFEKIMSYQSDYMRNYAKAYALWGEPKYLEAVKNIDRYLKDLLTSPEGVFYTSQDADLNSKVDGHKFYALDAKARAELGMPRIDKNIYTRENAWAIRGLLALYNVTNDQKVLERALKAARWIVKNHRLDEGGFSHGKSDRGGPFLSDNLAMGQAGLDLYAATGERRWLIVAAQAGSFIDNHLKHQKAGYITAKVSAAKVGVFAKPVRQIEENMQLARFANLLYRYHGDKKYQLMSQHVMRYLVAKNVTNQRRFLAGVLLADREMAKEPVHITIVGAKGDPKSQVLHQEGRKYAAQYKRLDWWDAKEGPLPNPDVQYPELDQPAAFACANQVCSLSGLYTSRTGKSRPPHDPQTTPTISLATDELWSAYSILAPIATRVGCRPHPLGESFPRTPSFLKGRVWEVSSQLGCGTGPARVSDLQCQYFKAALLLPYASLMLLRMAQGWAQPDNPAWFAPW